jgi:hypothetical protein
MHGEIRIFLDEDDLINPYKLDLNMGWLNKQGGKEVIIDFSSTDQFLQIIRHVDAHIRRAREARLEELKSNLEAKEKAYLNNATSEM